MGGSLIQQNRNTVQPSAMKHPSAINYPYQQGKQKRTFFSGQMDLPCKHNCRSFRDILPNALSCHSDAPRPHPISSYLRENSFGLCPTGASANVAIILCVPGPWRTLATRQHQPGGLPTWVVCETWVIWTVLFKVIELECVLAGGLRV